MISRLCSRMTPSASTNMGTVAFGEVAIISGGLVAQNHFAQFTLLTADKNSHARAHGEGATAK